MGLHPPLVHDLHGIKLPGLTALASVDLAEAPPAQGPEEDEVVLRDWLLKGGREGGREGGR
jgi:hypothetical protein